MHLSSATRPLLRPGFWNRPPQVPLHNRHRYVRRLVGNPALEGFTATCGCATKSIREDRTVPAQGLRATADDRRKGTEPSDAAGTLLFDVQQGRWSDEMIAALQLDPSILPPVLGSASVTGRTHRLRR